MSDYLPGFLARVQDWYRSQHPNDDRAVVGLSAKNWNGVPDTGEYPSEQLHLTITFDWGRDKILTCPDDQESLWRFVLHGAP